MINGLSIGFEDFRTFRKALSRDLIPMICRNGEIEVYVVMSGSLRVTIRFRLVFSIKESVYKCLFPSSSQHLRTGRAVPKLFYGIRSCFLELLAVCMWLTATLRITSSRAWSEANRRIAPAAMCDDGF
jgi:hypothetical protein